MKVTIDRFEGEYILIEMEDKAILQVPTALLSPLHPKEGDVVNISLAKTETAVRLQKSKTRLKFLFRA